MFGLIQLYITCSYQGVSLLRNWLSIICPEMFIVFDSTSLYRVRFRRLHIIRTVYSDINYVCFFLISFIVNFGVVGYSSLEQSYLIFIMFICLLCFLVFFGAVGCSLLVQCSVIFNIFFILYLCEILRTSSMLFNICISSLFLYSRYFWELVFHHCDNLM